uniref:Uncharacterized protein n=1 Tax=Panagrolaimus sp. JU765 TaxID=591449 RepID=A0AC34QSU2_9BILA
MNQDGATFPIIHNRSDNECVTNLSLTLDVEVWLGLRCSSTSSCVWDDRSAYDYDNFVDGVPNLSLGQCAYLSLGTGKQGKWQSADCGLDYRATICQTNALSTPGQCKEPFSLGEDGRCYYANKNASTFTNAEDVCRSFGANLVSIENSQQNLIVKTLLDAAGIVNAFIGLTFVGNTYVWTDPQAAFNYTNWESGFPVSSIGSCVLMDVGASIECEYYLVVSQGGHVSVKFAEVDLKPNDYLDLYDGNNTVIARLYDGEGTGQYFATAYSNSMKIVFASYAGSATNRGWLLNFASTNILTTSVFPPNVCPQTFYYDHGTISSPGYPNDYGNGLNCTYVLQAATGYVVKIVFEIFELNRFDTVALYNGPDESSPIITVLSGTYSPNTQTYQSTTPSMTVRFLTDQTLTATGFLATFRSAI